MVTFVDHQVAARFFPVTLLAAFCDLSYSSGLQSSILLYIYGKHMGFEQLHERGLFCMNKGVFSAY